MLLGKLQCRGNIVHGVSLMYNKRYYTLIKQLLCLVEALVVDHVVVPLVAKSKERTAVAKARQMLIKRREIERQRARLRAI